MLGSSRNSPKQIVISWREGPRAFLELNISLSILQVHGQLTVHIPLETKKAIRLIRFGPSVRRPSCKQQYSVKFATIFHHWTACMQIECHYVIQPRFHFGYLFSGSKRDSCPILLSARRHLAARHSPPKSLPCNSGGWVNYIWQCYYPQNLGISCKTAQICPLFMLTVVVTEIHDKQLYFQSRFTSIYDWRHR
jgi:hypothetical protein